MTTLKIGLFGFGSVGQGFYKQASSNSNIHIGKIAVKTRNKPRTLAPRFFTYDKNDILNDPSIDLVVEAIDDHKQSFDIVSAALKNKKHVVTANKKMLALHLKELLKLQRENGVYLLYEASSLGSIPAIKNIEEYFGDEQILSLSGIFNGTSNFILSRIFNERIDYTAALKQAQDLGFAEADPTNDVEGFDAKYKLIILSLHAFGVVLHPGQIPTIGINNLKQEDIDYANKLGLKIKLVPKVINTPEGIHAFVLPHFVSPDELLFHIENEYNILVVDGAYTGSQTYTGKGAGSDPTGSAVFKDVLNVFRKHSYRYTKLSSQENVALNDSILIEVYLRTNGSHEDIPFESILEKGSHTRDHFSIGYISQQTLLQYQQELLDRQAVIIATGNLKYAIRSFLSETEQLSPEENLVSL